MQTFYYIIFLLLFVLMNSCGNGEKCKVLSTWKVQEYKIEELECPDLVLRNYTSFSVIVNGKTLGSSASQIDSCVFTWQASDNQYVQIDVCTQNIQVKTPKKDKLDLNTIDSIVIMSNHYSEKRHLTRDLVGRFVNDWNLSTPRGYEVHPFDSAFSATIPYQYEIMVYSNAGNARFFGYNYIILDKSGWKYKMASSEKLNYFNEYWEK